MRQNDEAEGHDGGGDVWREGETTKEDSYCMAKSFKRQEVKNVNRTDLWNKKKQQVQGFILHKMSFTFNSKLYDKL